MSMEEYKYGTVEHKVREIAGSMEGFGYLFADFAQANVAIDKIEKPTILYMLPPSGKLNLHRDVMRDKPETQIWFLCPSDFDFEGEDNDCRIEAMKRGAIKFIKAINDSGEFELLEGDIPYQVAYDTFDDNLTGLCISPILVEKKGMSLCGGEFSRIGRDKED